MNPAAIVIPLIVVLVGFDVYCLIDIARADEVRGLPKWVWVIICLDAVGGLVRLLDPVGYDRWWFTPTAPFVRGYQAGLQEARQAAVRAPG